MKRLVLLIVVLLALALIGAPLFSVIAASAMLGFQREELPLLLAAFDFYGIAEMPILLAIPLFTFAGVVLAAGGYPDSYRKGDVISGLENTETASTKVFHAGTAERNGEIVTAGGRVLCATALGETVADAQAAAYTLAQQVCWDEMLYRKDIAYRAIAREQS